MYVRLVCFHSRTNPCRFSLRRSALRVLSSSPSSLGYKQRSITSLSSSSPLRAKPASTTLQYQRRWATTEAEEQKSEEEAPISKLQSTPAEEVENAIDSDNAKAAEPASETVTEAVKSTLSGETSGTVGGATSQEYTPAQGAGAKQAGRFPTPGPSGEQGHISREERISQPKPTVYLGNLFFDVTEEDLSRELSRFGAIQKIRLLRDSRGLSKGYVPSHSSSSYRPPY